MHQIVEFLDLLMYTAKLTRAQGDERWLEIDNNGFLFTIHAKYLGDGKYNILSWTHKNIRGY